MALSPWLAALKSKERRWTVTGVAGFIGSHILETLLLNGQQVRGLDNFSTGSQSNLEQVRNTVGPDLWKNFIFIQGDIRLAADCQEAVKGSEIVLHQAALGSVPRSIADPVTSHQVNVDGFINVVLAARDAKVTRMVYASSSSVYGNSLELPKHEEMQLAPRSPYAVTKLSNELYASVFGSLYSVPLIGLRYFNVFGPRQSPAGPYAAVIPLWIAALSEGRPCLINGDGSTSRDFCYVQNAVQANILAGLSENSEAIGQQFNVSVGGETSLLQLFTLIQAALIQRCKGEIQVHLRDAQPQFQDFRAGDVKSSRAAIKKAKEMLGYSPEFGVEQGLGLTVDSFLAPQM